jgi:hypothetical protein
MAVMILWKASISVLEGIDKGFDQIYITFLSAIGVIDRCV